MKSGDFAHSAANGTLPPIAVFAYNRPNHLSAVLQSLEQSMQFFGQTFSLYIYCDAAKDEKKKDAVERTRNVALNYSLNRPNVHVIVRPTNFGFKNIVDGISEMCAKYGKVIIVEDDIIVSPDFLPFMTNALNFYENNPRIFMVSGFMYNSSHSKNIPTFGMQTSFIWGWATWKRAWDHFSWGAEGWEKILSSKKFRYKFDVFGSFPFSKMLKETMTGQIAAWGPQWIYAIHKHNAFGIHPYRSLTWNCGTGGGTHGEALGDEDPLLCKKEYYIHGNREVTEFSVPQLPQEVYSGHAFVKEVSLNKLALRRLAFTFLQERLRTEKRKRKLILKMIQQGFLYPFSIISKK